MALTPVQEAQVLDLIAQQSALLSLAGVEATILSKLGATKVTLSDLPTASVIDDADLLLLRQGVTDKSVTGLTFKNLIPVVSDASTTVKGIVELATDAETQAGTDTVRAITPSNLSARTATETRTGIAELATDAEAQAFTADKFIDGAKLNTAFKGSNQSLATSGYQKLPGGLILQWGSDASTPNGTVNVTFPISFVSAVVFTQASFTQDMGISGTDVISTTTQSITGMTLRTATNEAGNPTYNWVAIGY